jgi:hypothetical protein
MANVLDRAAILAMRPTRVAEVALPGEASVFVRELGAGEKNDWLLSVSPLLKKGDAAAAQVESRYFCLVAANADGSRLLDDRDADAVRELPAAVVALVTAAGRRLNVMGEDAEAAAKKD